MARPTLSLDAANVAVYNRNLVKLFNEQKTFRQFVWTSLRDAGIYYPTIVPGDAVMSAFQEGKRAGGLETLHQMQALIPDFLGRLHAEFGFTPKNVGPVQPQGDDDEHAQPPLASADRYFAPPDGDGD